MNKNYDFLIIGGGVNGTSIAMHLSEMGIGSVALLEKKGLATGATGRSGAMIREHYLTPELVRMSSKARSFFEQWPADYGYEINFHKTGRILLFGENDANSARKNADMNRMEGVSIETLDTKAVSKMIPDAVLEDIELALFEPEAGYADPVATTYAFASEAIKNGADIYTDCEVTGIMTRGDRVTGVSSNKGIFETAVVINVTGPWANILLAPLGEKLPIEPTRVQMVHLRRPPSLVKFEHIVIDHTCGAYYRNDGSPNTLIGGEAPEDMMEIADPNNFGLNADHMFIERYWSRITRRVPEFRNAICRGGYGSLYDMTPDGNPIIDRSPNTRNLYNVAGFSGHGFKLSPVIGSLVSKLVNSDDISDDYLTMFREDRFITGNEIIPEFPYGNRAHQ